MSRIPRSLRVGVTTSTAVVFAASSWALAAATVTLQVVASPDVFITEVQTTNTTASEEFVELYNNTDDDIDLADAADSGKSPWKLQFFNSSATTTGSPDWTRPSASLSLTGTIAAHSYFLLSTSQAVSGITNTYKPGGIDPDQTYSARMSDTGGGLQLVKVSGASIAVHDRAVWQKPIDGQMLPDGVLATPPAGASFQRLPNSDGEYVQEDGSLAAFAPETLISPKDAWAEPVPVDTLLQTDSSAGNGDSNSDGTTTDTQDTGSSPATPAEKAAQTEPVITELLPNPASPQNDAENEYIELYNPNDTSFDLTGYTLEAGTTTLHDFTFTNNASLPPHSYTAFFSSLTKIVLANGGSQARLLSADKEIVSETDAYTTASEGQTWAWDSGAWHWTTTPTPGAGNLFTAPAALATNTYTVKIGKAAPSAQSKAKVKGVSTTKSKSKKSPAKTTKKTSKNSLSSSGSSKPGAAQDDSQVTPLHPWTLAAVGIAAILYGVYEYRVDIKNYFYKRARDRAARRAARAQT